MRFFISISTPNRGSRPLCPRSQLLFPPLFQSTPSPSLPLVIQSPKLMSIFYHPSVLQCSSLTIRDLCTPPPGSMSGSSELLSISPRLLVYFPQCSYCVYTPRCRHICSISSVFLFLFIFSLFFYPHGQDWYHCWFSCKALLIFFSHFLLCSLQFLFLSMCSQAGHVLYVIFAFYF